MNEPSTWKPIKPMSQSTMRIMASVVGIVFSYVSNPSLQVYHLLQSIMGYTVPMTPLAQSELFFFVSSMGFMILGVLVAILMIICIKGALSFVRILKKVETSVDSIGDATVDLIEDVRDSGVFRLLFQPKKKRTQKSSK